ncbi:hypothetical protein SETIT_2G078800v2 [Setaria italica]|uniref:Uncharacterized protein n=1 Tax=Setaria italica TaxID=4555 RepID=A0A368PWB5_SETIT|nr:hypothetical protein SETIT_2G078800v2 [Setaria italica]
MRVPCQRVLSPGLVLNRCVGGRSSSPQGVQEHGAMLLQGRRRRKPPLSLFVSFLDYVSEFFR